MEFYNADHIKIVVFSLFLGLIFGLLYDIIRINQILMGSLSFCAGKTEPRRGFIPHFMLGICDLIYILALTVVFSVFVFAVNNGDFRWFIAVGCAVGCFVYHMTVGRLVVLVSGTVANAIRIAVNFVIVKPLVFAAKLICRAVLFVSRNTVGRVICLIKLSGMKHATERARRAFKDDIRFADR